MNKTSGVFKSESLIGKVRRDLLVYKKSGLKIILIKSALCVLRKFFAIRILRFYTIEKEDPCLSLPTGKFRFDFIDYEHIKGKMLEEHYFSQEEILSQFKRGYRCFGAWHKDELVFVGWVHTARFVLPYCGQVRLPKHFAYITNCFTASIWRGNGIHPKALSALRSHLHGEDIDNLFFYIEFENFSSSRSVHKIGAKKIGYFLALKFGERYLRKIKVSDERFKKVLLENKFIGN